MTTLFTQPRDAVIVEGPDAASYLHSQMSNDIAGLAVGDACWSFLLQPTGKVDVLVRVWRRADDSFVVDTDAGFGEVMTQRLQRFKIRVKADVTETPWSPDLIGPSMLPPAGIDPEVARIEAAWPKMGAEITPGETIPAETGILAVAVNFTKGCYPGQELVERMDSRGSSAPRHIERIDVAPGTAVGADLVVDGHPATVTSVAGTRALASVRRATVSH